MGEIETINVRNDARKQQLEREREQELRRRRALKEQRRRRQLIRYYCICASTVMILFTVIVLIFNALLNGDSDTTEDKTTNTTVKEEETEAVGFDPSVYTFTQAMYKFNNSTEILERLEGLKASRADLADKIQYMLDNEKAYPENLIKLVAKAPETIDFALNYPFKRGQSNSIAVDISKEYTEGEIPLLIQWDDRWGYVSYGDDIIALDGCGPTCLSMVTVGLTGNVKWTPVRVARISEQNGHYVEGTGTAWTLMYEGCKQLGLEAKVIGLSETEMAAELNAGRPIIASMAPGDFTDAGHFIVFTEYKDGKFYVNDPNSKKNSEVGWEYDRIKTQIKNMWSYKVIE